MSRKLKGLSRDIAYAFSSRNNDISGYWGIGVICAHAVMVGDFRISIDLLAPGQFPATWERAFDRYRSIIASAADRQVFVTKADIELKFAQLGETNLYNCVGTVSLAGSNGRLWSHLLKVRCWPHDSERERKSNRD